MSFQKDAHLKKKRRSLSFRAALAFGILACLAGIASYAAHRSEIRISKVDFSGGVLVTAQDVSDETLSFLRGSYLWLFPKDNIFLYPHSALAERLMDRFKRIRTIDIHRGDLRSLRIAVTERTPSALWCDTLPGAGIMEDGALTQNCYFMDDTSTIFAEAPTFSGDAYFTYYGSVATSTPIIGSEYMASTSEFRLLSAFVDNIRGLGLRPQYIVAENGGEFVLSLSGGAELLFNDQEDFQKTFENLKTLLRSPALAPSPGGELPVEYIDLRFGNKLFYKLKGTSVN